MCGWVESASSTPSTSTWTRLELARMSTRLYGAGVHVDELVLLQPFVERLPLEAHEVARSSIGESRYAHAPSRATASPAWTS